MTSRLAKILVVDDDEVVRQLVADALQARGLAVVSAVKGRGSNCSFDRRGDQRKASHQEA